MKMRRLAALLLAILMSSLCVVFAQAEDGKVSYDGNAKEFVFEPGSKYSPTDLFSEFKDVMPGDSITQKITVRNDESKNVKIKVYMRALGAHEGSEDFLSKLRLRVQKDPSSEMAYMFDAPADQTAALTDWVYLGTLYSGGEIDLDVVLDVPTTLDNTYKELVGYLDWQFMVEESEPEPDDPQPPYTGDAQVLFVWAVVFAVSFGLLLFVIIKRKRDRDTETE